jgi:HPt (histidine-containing phosphotransfer) domain-containing protein
MSETLIHPHALVGFRELTTEQEPHFVKDFLTTVLAAIPPRLEKIRQAIGRVDSQALSFEAHALKSTCANAEIASMALLCTELEALGTSASIQGAAKLVSQLEQLNEKLKTEIHALPEFAD